MYQDFNYIYTYKDIASAYVLMEFRIYCIHSTSQDFDVMWIGGWENEEQKLVSSSKHTTNIGV